YASVLAAAAAAIGVVYLAMPKASAKPLTDKDVIVLADFANRTGEPLFDETLRAALAVALEQSPFLRIMDDAEVVQTLRRMGRPPDAPITGQIAREICQRQGQKATVGGSITKLGKTYDIELQAVNCQNGRALARERAEAASEDSVLKALSK